ncbi:MAG: hypothetical protein NC254_09190 [bacterium]|nr:hypothetical protein [bacterium]
MRDTADHDTAGLVIRLDYDTIDYDAAGLRCNRTVTQPDIREDSYDKKF